MARTTKNLKSLQSADYVRLASFRFALRRFLRFSEAAAAKVGLTGQHYQAMLAIRGTLSRRGLPINELARQLLIKHNSAVGLVDRLVAHGLVTRESSPDDLRKVLVRLSRKGEQVLGRLASVHRRKLKRIGPDIHRILGELTGAWRRRGVSPSEDP
jgi:DNA-binding MarR family transcriptional regulator